MTTQRRVLHSAQEVGDMVGVSDTCIRNWCRKGAIPSMRINNGWRNPARVVEQLADRTLELPRG